MTIAKENRIDHMKYMPDMEIIESDVMDRVISSMNACDFSKFTDADVDKAMMIIHKRLLSEKPVKKYGMNGCCVPGERRIYVTVDGNFKMLGTLNVYFHPLPKTIWKQ